MSSPIRSLKSGEYLFHEGDASHSMYLIKKGTIAIRKAKGSAFVELARAYTNEVVGELSFFDRQPRSAAAIATSPTDVQEITFESLDKIYKTVPDYLKTIMASVSERLRKADETIRRLQHNTVEAESAETPPVEEHPVTPSERGKKDGESEEP
ncbi:cyclic nucleotide-binding domain-containing protein [Bdellovibrionota bacterium FG-1]